VIDRETILRLASTSRGFEVHVFKWSHDQKRRLANRMKDEGLLIRKKWHDHFVYYRKKEGAGDNG